MAGTKRPQGVRQNATTETISIGSVSAPQSNVVSTANSSDFDTLNLIRVNSLGGNNTASIFAGIDKSQGFLDINLKSIGVTGDLTLTETPSGIVLSTKNTDNGTTSYLENAVNLSNSGARVYAGLDGQTINFRTIDVGPNLTLEQTSDKITISLNFTPPTGDVSGGANVGATSGFGLYAGKDDTQLLFRKLGSGNSFITLSNDSSGNQVIMTFNEGNINLANIMGTLPTSRITGLSPIATNPSYANLTNTPSIPSTLNDLSDVSGSPTTGQYLKYDGANGWIPSALTAQNAITTVKAGSSIITATSSTTDLEFQSGSELDLTANTVNRTIAYNLKPTGITAGTYTNPAVQVDVFGRVVSISSGSAPGTSNYVDPLNVKGDILIRGNSSTARLPIGGGGQYLVVENGLPAWRPLTLPGTAGTVKQVTVLGIGPVKVGGESITTSGVYTISLAPTGVAAGSYSNPTLEVDVYGRIKSIGNSGVVPNSVIAGAGLTGGGSLVEDVTLGLEAVGTYGQYSNATITVDEYGRVTQAQELGVVFEMVSNLDISTLGSAINTVGKRAGKAIIDSTNMTLMISTGSNANSDWISNGGNTTITPA